MKLMVTLHMPVPFPVIQHIHNTLDFRVLYLLVQVQFVHEFKAHRFVEPYRKFWLFGQHDLQAHAAHLSLSPMPNSLAAIDSASHGFFARTVRDLPR
jgi:hypothetical protein